MDALAALAALQAILVWQAAVVVAACAGDGPTLPLVLRQGAVIAALAMLAGPLLGVAILVAIAFLLLVCLRIGAWQRRG